LRVFIKEERITEETIIKQHTAPKKALAVYAIVDDVNLENAPKQLELFYEIQAASEPTLMRDLTDRGYSNHLVNELYKKGYIEKTEVEIERDPFKNKVFEADKKKALNAEQQENFNQIKQSIDARQDDIFLLHGITGSG